MHLYTNYRLVVLVMMKQKAPAKQEDTSSGV